MMSILGRVGIPETFALALSVLALFTPYMTSSLLTYSILNQSFVAIPAALSVYLMLRLNLLTFATPAFMAIGGYTAGILALNGIDNAIILILLSFVAPAIIAVPLGTLVLRLRGTYFVLVTFVLSEILQFVLFDTPNLTGGTNGLAGIPPTSFFAFTFSSVQSTLLLSAIISLISVIVTIIISRSLARQFSAINENEVLAESLGLAAWRYKLFGFCVAAGVAGFAGYSMVNMLTTAQPTMFDAISSVDYIAYAVVGGRDIIMGPIIGSGLLVWAANLFGSQGQYSQGLFGLLIMIVALVGKRGIMGLLAAISRTFVVFYKSRVRDLPKHTGVL